MDINYQRGGAKFTSLVEKIQRRNVSVVKSEFSEEFRIFSEILDTMYSIVSEFAWAIKNPHIADLNAANTVLFSAVHKNFIALHASLKLTSVGLYGPARSIFRHTYEALLIAKFCSVSADTLIYEKWKEGDIVRLANGVLKKIKHPDTEFLFEFWGLMSEYSHATIYSQQISLNIENKPNEVPLNFVYLSILLECLYHLINRHLITSSMIYYTRRYRRGADTLASLKKKMRMLLEESRAGLPVTPKKIIRSYCAEWQLR